MLHWGLGRRFARWGPSSLVDSDATALIAAMTVPPDATRQALINTTITAVKAAGVWTKLDLLFLAAAHDVQAGKLNWINPASAPLVAQNSPTFTTDRGFTGDAATSFLQTTGVNLSALALYRQDDATMFGWSLTDGANAGSEFGVNGGGTPYFILRNVAGNLQSKFNSATAANVINPGAIGFFGASRNNAADYQHYKNGAAFGTASAAVSQAVFTLPVSLCKGLGLFSIRQMACLGVGKALTSTEWAALYAALLAYMQGVGAA